MEEFPKDITAESFINAENERSICETCKQHEDMKIVRQILVEKLRQYKGTGKNILHFTFPVNLIDQHKADITQELINLNFEVDIYYHVAYEDPIWLSSEECVKNCKGKLRVWDKIRVHLF